MTEIQTETGFKSRPELLDDEQARYAYVALLHATAANRKLGRKELIADIEAARKELFKLQKESRHSAEYPVYDAACTARIVNALLKSDDLMNGEAPEIVTVAMEKVARALNATGRRLIDNGYTRNWFAMDIWAITRDETQYWTYKEQPWAKYVERIEGVYIFDKNVVTHLCSFSGSYWLEHIEDRVIWKDEPEVPDDLRESANDWIYSNGGMGESSNYFDEKDINRFLELHKSERFRVFNYGNPGLDWNDVEGDDDNERHNEAMGGLLDSFRSNCII